MKKAIFLNINHNNYRLAYILGVVGVGDGYISISKKNRGYVLGLEVKDKDFIIAFKKSIESRYNIKKEIRRRINGMYSLCICSKAIVYDILKYGKLKDFKECIEKIPSFIKESKDKRLIGNYLKAFFDSQGSVDVSSRKVTASKKNEEIIKDIQKLLNILKINSCIIKTPKNQDVIKISDYKSIKNFDRYIGFDILRKESKVKKILNYYKIYYNVLPKNNLRNLYISRNKSMIDISNFYNVSLHKVFNWLRRYNIKARSLSEARKLYRLRCLK